jgi:hypothetical protein
VSSLVLVLDIAAKTGASFTALTVRENDLVSVSSPSEITTVMVLVPFWLSAGDKEREQFGAVPDFVMLAFGRSVVLDDVTVMELVQLRVESTSTKE